MLQACEILRVGVRGAEVYTDFTLSALRRGLCPSPSGEGLGVGRLSLTETDGLRG